MAALYFPVIVCVIFVIGAVAQQEGHTGHTVHGVHGGHGGQVIRQKLSDTVDASIARATDPFGVSQGRRPSSHSSHATHGEHGTHGVQTRHGSHAIIGGSHGVQGHGSHGSNSKARQSNHGIQKSDNTEHHQTSTHQDSTHGQGSTFEQTGHGIDSGKHLDHKTVVQEVTKSHDRPVPKVQDGHSIIEINALSSHSGHSIPARTAITEIGSHATHGEHEAHGVQTGHGGHAIIGGSHGIQGQGSHDNHGIQKLDHTEHHQTSTYQGSEHGQGINFEQIGHGIDSGRHSDHKTVVQDVTKSHGLPVHKVQDGQSISEINAVSSHAGHNIPTHTSIIKHDTTNNLKSDHEIHVHGSVRKQNINAENMHHGHALSSLGTQERHDSHVKDMHVGHSIPSLTNQQDINMHSGQDMKKEATKDTHNAHSVHGIHALPSQNSHPQNNDAGHDRHTMPSHEATLASNIDHNAHSGNVKPSIENKHNLPGLNAHEIHAGHSMTTQSGSANPSRHSMIEGSETMTPPEHEIHVSPSHDVHEVPTIIQNISTKQIEHGGHFTPIQDKSDNIVISGTSKEIHHGVHTPDANIQRILGTPSHLPQSFTQLPDKNFVHSLSNVNNQWHHSNIRHISPKPQVHDVHSGHENFNMKNPQKPSDGIRSGLNETLAEHSDHRMNGHLPIVMLKSNSVDPSAKDSTVNQNNGGHTMKNDTKPNFVDVVGTRQSNKQPPLDWVTQRGHELHKTQQQLRKENIHTVTGLMEGLNSKKEALSNVGLIGHIDQGEMELHDHPVDPPASSSNPDGIITADPNLHVDRSRIHTDTESNVPKVNKGTGPQTSNVHTTSRVANSAGSSLNLNNFLENINAQLNNKGFGFTEPSMSNSGVSNSLGQQSRGAIMRQDNHNISAHTGSSFDAGTVSNWGQGKRDTFTGFNHNSGMRDRNNRHQLPPTTPSPPTESTTVFVQQFSGEPTSMDSVFMRMFDPLTADMMFNRNVYPPVVDPFNDPRVPHNHGPMPSPAQNNGFSLFDLFAGEF